MPVRTRKDRRRHHARITPEAIEIFRRAHKAPTSADRIALAAALGRSKFAANPLDSEPRSLIGCDTEPVAAVLDLRAQLLKKISD
jgi:DNA-binding MarR family transcriptional regulator